MNSSKLFAFCLFTFAFLGGCAVVEFLTPEKPPFNEEIIAGYEQVALKTSTAGDVLAAIHQPKYQLLSQSKSVIASAGERKKGYRRWFTLVAFDEEKPTAARKYLFIEDERPKFLFIEPWEYARLDAELVLSEKVLNEPYSNDNARRIAILKSILEDARKDLDQVNKDNKIVSTGGMMINQAFETVSNRLDAGPALAARLTDVNALEFDHPNLNKGRVQMIVEGDVAKVKMRLGSLVPKFEKEQRQLLEKQQQPQAE